MEYEEELEMSRQIERNPKIEKLILNKETVQELTDSQAEQVKGGWIRPPITWSCPQPAPPPPAHTAQ
jgi:hypothetical protein